MRQIRSHGTTLSWNRGRKHRLHSPSAQQSHTVSRIRSHTKPPRIRSHAEPPPTQSHAEPPPTQLHTKPTPEMPSLSSCLETIESRIFELEVRWLKKSLHKYAESLHWRLKRLEELPAVEETVQEDEVPGLACQVSSLEVRTSKLEIGQGSAGNSGPDYSFDEETIYQAIAADSTLNYLFDEEDIYNASAAPDFGMNFIDDEEVIYDAIPALRFPTRDVDAQDFQHVDLEFGFLWLRCRGLLGRLETGSREEGAKDFVRVKLEDGGGDVLSRCGG